MMCETKRLSPRVSWTFILCLAVVGARAAAQDEPKDTKKKPVAVPAAKVPVPAEAGKETPAAKETPASKETKPEAPPETDPFVLAILEVKPTTPEQWLLDIRALIQLNRPELAKAYLKQFSEPLPAADELAKLQTRFGSALFLQLSTLESLQPEGANVGNAVMQAADARIRNAQRLKGLVDRLDDENAAAKRLAVAELVQAGPIAVPVLIQALADKTRAAGHPAVVQTLQAIGSGAVDPLIATLEATDRNLTTAVIRVLGSLKARKAIPFLLALAWSEDSEAAEREAAERDAARQALEAILESIPTRNEALVFLTRQLDSNLSGTVLADVDEEGNVTLWAWDAEQQVPIERTLPASDASFENAACSARQLYRVAPAQGNHRIMHLATALEVAKRKAGYDRNRQAGYDDRPLTVSDTPVVAEAAQSGPDVLEQVLELALSKNLYGAAIAAVDLLGETQDVSRVQSSDGQPRLLTQSLLSPNRRVQFAAARAIMKLDPRNAYAGSSHLLEVLGYLSASGGRQRVLIGDPRADVAQSLAGFFDELGFDADTEFEGRKLALRAFDSPDYVFALISDAIDRPAYGELVQILRKDPRTADMPIGVLVRDVNAQAAQRLADSDNLTLAFPPPQTREDVAVDAQRMLQVAGRRLVSADDRLQEASFALDKLTTLAEDSEKYGFYDVMRLESRMRQALTIPALAAKAARVLGLLGSPGAQQALIEFANVPVQPLADRQAAAAAFRMAVDRRGLLLTRIQLQKQYALYNASESRDRGTQEVLAALLDAMEAPTRKADPVKKED